MLFLTYAGLQVPKRLVPSFEKVRLAIERDGLRSVDVKKLAPPTFLDVRLTYSIQSTY